MFLKVPAHPGSPQTKSCKTSVVVVVVVVVVSIINKLLSKNSIHGIPQEVI